MTWNYFRVNYKYNNVKFAEELEEALQLFFSWVCDEDEENKNYFKMWNSLKYYYLIKHKIAVSKMNEILTDEELEEILQNGFYYDALEEFEQVKRKKDEADKIIARELNERYEKYNLTH